LQGAQFILGPKGSELEGKLAAYVGAKHAIGCSSGTDALLLALMAYGVKAGDEIVTSPFTFIATAEMIALVGATPVFVDIDPDSFTMDPNALEDALRRSKRKKPKAVIPVHLFGHPADMSAILEIANRHNLRVVEDCAQSHGAAIGDRKTGTWGHLSAFSFYPTKNLGALGDGGAVVTNDPALAERLRQLREYGFRERYVSHLSGMNTRLDELQAAILRVKLQYLRTENARRLQIARIYGASLSGTTLVLPQLHAKVDPVFHLYVVRSTHRDGLKAFLKENSVGTSIHYPVPVHLQPAYHGRAMIGRGGLEHTEQVCREILSLPMYPQMTDEQVQRIGHLIARWDSQKGEAS